MMSNCYHCGGPLDEGTTICTRCGAVQTGMVADTPKAKETPESALPKAQETTETPEPQASQEPQEPIAPLSLEKAEMPVESVSTEVGDEKTFTERYFFLLMGGGIAGILAIVAIFVLLFLPAKAPKWETPILQAFENTHAALKAEFSEASDTLGLTPILKEFASKGLTQEYRLSVPVPSMGTIGVHALQAENANGDQLYGSVDASVMGFTFSLLELSLEKNYMALASPFLFRGAYGLSLDNLAQTLPASELGQQSGLSQEALTAFADYLNAAARFKANGYALSDTTNNALRSTLLTLEGALLCSEPTEETISFDTGELTCSVYRAQIPPEALESFLLDGADILLSEDLISAYCRLLYALEGYSDVDPLAEIKADWAEEVRDLTEALQAAELTVYLRDGIALRTDLSLRSEDDDVVQLSVQLNGNGRLTDRVTIQASPDKTHQASLFWHGNLMPEDGMVEGGFDLFLKEGGSTASDTLALTGSFHWNSAQSADNLSFDLKILGEPARYGSSPHVTMDGSVSLEGGIHFDPVDYSYSDQYGQAYSASASLHLTPTQELKSLTSQATDILSMDAEALRALLQEIESSANRLGGFL